MSGLERVIGMNSSPLREMIEMLSLIFSVSSPRARELIFFS